MTLEIIPGALYKVKNGFFAAIFGRPGGDFFEKNDIIFLLKQKEITKHSVMLLFLSKGTIFNGWFDLNIITNFIEKC